MTDYYLAPETWDISSYRGIYTIDIIDNLPDDWEASIDDCEYLGDHETYEDAIRAAIDKGYLYYLSPADRKETIMKLKEKTMELTLKDMKLTLKDAKKYHKELWQWLEDNPKMDKEDWPGWREVPLSESFVDDNQLCFACMIAEHRNCPNCPIKWPGKDCCDLKYRDNKGVFNRWYCAENSTKKRKQLARAIKNMPWRLANVEKGI